MNVTYYIGAGASAGALPTIENMGKKIQECYDDLTNNKNLSLTKDDYSQHNGLSLLDYELMLFNDLLWLKKICEDHISVDTYAKKLFIQNNMIETQKLKLILTVYFVIEHNYKITIDIRYDNFIASLIDNNTEYLPTNVNIISWNYDFQFEKSLKSFLGDDSTYTVDDLINIYPSIINPDHKLNNKFSVFKLNGKVGYRLPNYYSYETFIETNYPEINKDFMIAILTKYRLFSTATNRKLLLSFAWENTPEKRQTIEFAKQKTKGTEILVVIGYSFPYVNREIDRDIIRSMPELKKVYFQAPDDYPLEYIQSFECIIPNCKERGIQLIPINKTRQFFIPSEL
ncbi:MAG: hypothetical protein ABIJ97_13230 [Bacteroidota bacterium]